MLINARTSYRYKRSKMESITNKLYACTGILQSRILYISNTVKQLIALRGIFNIKTQIYHKNFYMWVMECCFKKNKWKRNLCFVAFYYRLLIMCHLFNRAYSCAIIYNTRARSKRLKKNLEPFRKQRFESFLIIWK